MRQSMLSLSIVAVAFGASVAHAAVTDEQVQALEARLAQLEAENAASAAASGKASERLKINGFMSAGVGWADVGAPFSYDTGLDDTLSFKADSVVGLQFDARVNDQVNAVVQLVGRGVDDFDAGIEWAYLGYRPTQVDEIRVGRLRASFFLLDEYLEVGYAYPWARPPAELYQADFPSAYDGISWTHKINAGEWQHDILLNWGATRTPEGGTGQMDATDAWTLGLTSTHGDWLFGAKVSGARLTANNALFDALASIPAPLGPLMAPIDENNVSYRALGAQYDNGKLLVLAEGTQLRIDGIVPDSDNAYLTVGYRFGKVMPHLTYSTKRLVDENEPRSIAALPMLCPAANPDPDETLCLRIVPNVFTPGDSTDSLGIPFPADTLARMLEAEQDSVTLGVRYDFLPNAALKVDWTRVLDTHNSFGMYSAENGNVFYDAAGGLLSPPVGEVDVFRVVVDAVF